MEDNKDEGVAPITATQFWEKNKEYWEEMNGKWEIERKKLEVELNVEFAKLCCKHLQDKQWYVVSHGCSLKTPGIFGKMQAEWLKAHGVEVLSHKEYMEKLNES